MKKNLNDMVLNTVHTFSIFTKLMTLDQGSLELVYVWKARHSNRNREPKKAWDVTVELMQCNIGSGNYPL